MTKSLALLHFCVFSSPIYLDVPQKEVSGATLMLGGDYIVMRQHSSLNSDISAGSGHFMIFIKVTFLLKTSKNFQGPARD